MRKWLYPSTAIPLLAAVLTLQSQLTSVQFSINGLVLVTGGYAFVVLLVELLIRRKKGRRLGFQAAASQKMLFNVMEPLADHIRRSTRVDLLGGTFKSFTDNEENLNAVAHVLSGGGRVRILMLHPDGDGLASLTSARQDRTDTISFGTLSREAVGSLRRVKAVVGMEKLCRITRLYRAHPTCSVYRLDRSLVLTCYTYGRGASSPAVLVEEDESNVDFCRSLDRGFQELWAAGSTAQLTLEVFAELQESWG